MITYQQCTTKDNIITTIYRFFFVLRFFLAGFLPLLLRFALGWFSFGFGLIGEKLAGTCEPMVFSTHISVSKSHIIFGSLFSPFVTLFPFLDFFLPSNRLFGAAVAPGVNSDHIDGGLSSSLVNSMTLVSTGKWRFLNVYIKRARST